MDDDSLTPVEWLDENSSVLRDLASYDKSVRQEAILRFKELDRERGTAVILGVLSDPQYDDYRVEVVLSRLLADYRDERAIPYLLRYMAHPDDGAVQIAAEGLDVYRDNARVIAALEELLRSASPRDRLTASELLYKARTASTPAVVAGLYRGESNKFVRGNYLRILIDSDHPRRTEFLIDALNDPDETLREVAWGVLQRDTRLPAVGFDAHGSDADRARSVGALRTWLKTRRGTNQ